MCAKGSRIVSDPSDKEVRFQMIDLQMGAITQPVILRVLSSISSIRPL